MLTYLIRGCVLIGLVTFGLRGILGDLGVPGWSLMLGFILGVGIVLLVHYLAGVIHYLLRWIKLMINRRFPEPVRLVSREDRF